LHQKVPEEYQQSSFGFDLPYSCTVLHVVAGLLVTIYSWWLASVRM